MPTLNIDPSIHYVKFMRGSTSAWDILQTTPDKISDDTLYFIYENTNVKEGKLYLGQKLISGSGDGGSSIININDLGDINIDGETLADKQILVYNDTTNKWENANLSVIIDTALGEFVGATAAANGQAGLVPAPKAGDQDKFLRGDKKWVTIDIPAFDSNVFQKNGLNEITLAGFTSAPIGAIPVKTSNGIEWDTRSSGNLKREITTLEDLNQSIADQTADENTIFMVLNDSTATDNKYDEYMIIQGKVERLGSFGQVDLNDYVKKTEFTTAINNLNNLLQDTTDPNSGDTIPGLISRVTTIENNYITKAEIGDLSKLNFSTGNTTLVDEINTINDTLSDVNERLTWHDLEDN